MKEFPKRRIKFYEEQYWYAKEFLNKHLQIEEYKNKNVLEVGSAEGGGIKYYFEQGANCWGVEISKGRNDFAIEYVNEKNIKFLEGDICDDTFVKELPHMDLILIRDVIEHIPNKLSALKNLNKLLKPDGIIFLSYPPKYSPYAGHQQNIKKRIGSLPFIHLLPKGFYKLFLSSANLNNEKINEFMQTRRDMIAINKIEKLFHKAELTIKQKDFYFIRPCFEKRFGWKPKKVIFNNIPILKEIFTLGALYQLGKK
ncbi:MAG: class I SAM-dependent methyltransferase [Melioribacteraceae bacterium]